MTINVSGDKCPAAATLWRGKQVAGGEKRQRAGAVQDALRGTGDHWRVWETHEILNSVIKKGRNTANTGLFEHTTLSRRLANHSRQTREIQPHRGKSSFIVFNRVSENPYKSHINRV